MRKFKTMFLLLWYQLQTVAYRKRCVAGYLVGIASIAVTSVNYYHFLGTAFVITRDCPTEEISSSGSTPINV